MNNEEAIKNLAYIVQDLVSNHSPKDKGSAVEALAMAMEALEAPITVDAPTHTPTTVDVSTDLISRQAAIDILDDFEAKTEEGLRFQYAIAREAMLALPSARPTAIKDCRNCKHGHYNDIYDTPFCYNPKKCDNWENWEPDERPTGKWVDYIGVDLRIEGQWLRDDGKTVFVQCDQCKEIAVRNLLKHDNFCPNCGADMRGCKDDR